MQLTWTRLSLLLVVIFSAPTWAEDWPQWRYDSNRSASSTEQLPDSLHRRWQLRLPPRVPVWDDPLNHDLMPYDRSFEPIVAAGRVFVGFNDSDKLVAYDSQTGKHLWSFFTDGPVRLPAAAWQDKVYFVSDDGHLYCVRADDGELVWKFRGAPSARKAIGNQRVISAWPARGAPVVRDGQVYFAASIWPFMGTFIYALDAQDGDVLWVNDSTGSQYIQQPHSAPSFAGVAPQGALVATERRLIVPGGRSVPAVFDRGTGKFRHFHINAGGKGTGGSFVAADESRFYVHTRVKGVRGFDLETGVKTAFLVDEPVLGGDLVFASTRSEAKEPVLRAYDAEDQVVWELPVDASGDLIRAGDRLYAAGQDKITTVQLVDGGRQAEIGAVMQVDEPAVRLLAADGQLLTVSLEGGIAAYGDKPASNVALTESSGELKVTAQALKQAEALLAEGPTEGYALWFGAADTALLDAVVAQSPFVELTVVEEDEALVKTLRNRYDDVGVYGRVTVHQGSPDDFMAPYYVAHRVFVGPRVSATLARTSLRELYASVRPYGGTLTLMVDDASRTRLGDQVRETALERAVVQQRRRGFQVTRQGQLPGAANWTHQHGDIANSVKSNDRRVKLPLGVLWFGGNSNVDVLPRHGHGPPEQVVGGRLFIEGMNSLSARDVYTGRSLWKREFEDLGTFDVYYDQTFRDTPLDPAYNQVHIPGANARGTNFVATSDRIYLLEGSVCHMLDPATGETIGEVRLPGEARDEEWGFIGVYKDVLLGGAGFANYRRRHGLSFAESDGKLSRSRAGFGSKSYDRSASVGLVGFDRHSGEVLWQVAANHSFWHNGIVAGGGRVYCLDRNPKPVEDAMRRRGLPPPETYRLAAFDYRTGELEWEQAGGVFGTWLGYSEEFDLLLQAGAKGSDRLWAETPNGMAVHRGADGTERWRNDELKYSGPCILHNDLILTNAPSRGISAGAFSLLDGSTKMVENPLTGEAQPWTISRAYGCNNIIASENLLTFRSGAAGFYDLTTGSGTGNFGGFKSGCTSNLVVADGVLNAPDYTKTCSCAYQNQTSLALVHLPDIEYWTVNHDAVTAADKRIERVGVNFGAPGDRRAESGTMWLEYPEKSKATDKSLELAVEVTGDANYYYRHSSGFRDADLPWVQGSGVESAQTIRISLANQNSTPLEALPYRVRLYFAEPDKSAPGNRVFDISLQGVQVLEDFDVAAVEEDGSAWREFPVTIERELTIEFTEHAGSSLLSGVEIIAGGEFAEGDQTQSR